MDLSKKPPWSGKSLKRLGAALVDDGETPKGCPQYDDVMLWHNDLAAAVKAIIEAREWAAFDVSRAAITARPKTLDTLVQKLRRESNLSLNQVQDLAGVRMDADFTLNRQLQFAQEVAEYFGEKSVVKDIREDPHSGYRAVHVWLRLPAGRVEIQFRTVMQSAWANTYERLGDIFGRGIRYGEMPGNAPARRLVESLHHQSEIIARIEDAEQQVVDLQDWLDKMPDDVIQLHGSDDELDSGLTIASEDLQARLGVAREELQEQKASYLDSLNELKSMLDEMEDD